MPTKYKSLTDIPYKARPAAGQAARGRAIKKLQGLDYKIVRVKRGRRTISLGVHPIEEAPAAVKAYRLENRGQAFQVLFLDPISKQDIARTYFAAGSTQIPESLTLKMAERYRLGGDVLIYIIIFETKATTKAAKKPAKKAAKKPAKKAAKKPAKKAAKKPAKKAAKKPVKKAAKKPVKKAAKKPAKKTMEQFEKQNSEIKTPIPAYGYSYAPYVPDEAFLKRRR